MTLDGAFEMPRSVLRIGAFGEKEVLYLRRAVEDELMRARGHQHSLLDHPQFDFEDLLEVLGTQRLEDDDLVDAVHELGRELAARRVHGRASNFFVERVVDLHRSRRKAQTAIDQTVHLGGAEVGGHDDDAAGKIDAAVVAERQCSLVQNSEQQLPQGVGSLLDFVEEQDRELQFFRVPLVERFLRQQRMRLTVAEVSRRRADELGNLVRVLELGAIDLDAGARIAKERLGHGFHNPRFARARRPQE